MEYRKEPLSGVIYNEETVIERYIKELPDAGAIIAIWSKWEKVDVPYDSKADTLLHIKRVSQLLTESASELIKRANIHDDSKLKSPEKEYFDKYTPLLKGSTYGSDEYKEFLVQLKVGLDHHYSNNSHHPEHYQNGINGMDLFDLIEMYVDWVAASERHSDGCIYKSIEINESRFKMNKQIVDIFNNTSNKLGFIKRET